MTLSSMDAADILKDPFLLVHFVSELKWLRFTWVTDDVSAVTKITSRTFGISRHFGFFFHSVCIRVVPFPVGNK